MLLKGSLHESGLNLIDFSTYTLKYVNKTSHFASNLYFGHNERRFHSEFHSRVKMIPNRHFIPDRVFNPE